MNSENLARSRGGEAMIDQRENSLNNCLDRAIEALEGQLDKLQNIAENLDGSNEPRIANKGPENKPLRPGHTLFKAKHLEDLINRVGEFTQRIHSNISG